MANFRVDFLNTQRINIRASMQPHQSLLNYLCVPKKENSYLTFMSYLGFLLVIKMTFYWFAGAVMQRVIILSVFLMSVIIAIVVAPKLKISQSINPEHVWPAAPRQTRTKLRRGHSRRWRCCRCPSETGSRHWRRSSRCPSTSRRSILPPLSARKYAEKVLAKKVIFHHYSE